MLLHIQGLLFSRRLFCCLDNPAVDIPRKVFPLVAVPPVNLIYQTKSRVHKPSALRARLPSFRRSDVPNGLRGIARDDCQIRNVHPHHRASRDDGASANSHSLHDH
jgi:hypothetical protein